MRPTIYQWARRHGVTPQALFELEQMFGFSGYCLPVLKGTSEAAVQATVRLEASKKGIKLFRNNVGVLKDMNGRPVRYGLANDSSQVNGVLKSGDLIGWRRVEITQDHVGCVIAQFVSRECKEHGWQYTGNAREKAQLAWAELVAIDGGDASFCTGEGTL